MSHVGITSYYRPGEISFLQNGACKPRPHDSREDHLELKVFPTHTEKVYCGYRDRCISMRQWLSWRELLGQNCERFWVNNAVTLWSYLFVAIKHVTLPGQVWVVCVVLLIHRRYGGRFLCSDINQRSYA